MKENKNCPKFYFLSNMPFDIVTFFTVKAARSSRVLFHLQTGCNYPVIILPRNQKKKSLINIKNTFILVVCVHQGCISCTKLIIIIIN